MSIVVAATQMAVTRVILRIANLLPRPDSLALAPASWRSIPKVAKKIFADAVGNLEPASCGISSRLAQSGGSDAGAP
jgi:hypothetical protein